MNQYHVEIFDISWADSQKSIMGFLVLLELRQCMTQSDIISSPSSWTDGRISLAGYSTCARSMNNNSVRFVCDSVKSTCLGLPDCQINGADTMEGVDWFGYTIQVLNPEKHQFLLVRRCFDEKQVPDRPLILSISVCIRCGALIKIHPELVSRHDKNAMLSHRYKIKIHTKWILKTARFLIS